MTHFLPVSASSCEFLPLRCGSTAELLDRASMRRTVLLGLLLGGCSSTPSGTIALTTGGEMDTFSRPPAPTSLHVDAVDSTGTVTPISQTSLPATTITLPDQSTSTTAALRVTGVDATGKTLVWGESLPFEFAALDGLTLSIFVQRNGEFARAPSPLPIAPSAPLTALVEGRYIVTAGGNDASQAANAQIYDTLGWATLVAPPTLPRAPLSMATVDTRLLLVDASAATFYDLSDSLFADVAAPTGGTYAEVAGGASIATPLGGMYIVGATRTKGEPTPRLLYVDPSGNLSFAALTIPRKGAAATWMDKRGLVITGGTSAGGTSPGVEVLTEGLAQATAYSFPPDATTGGSASALDDARVLLAGGVDAKGNDAGARVIDFTCTCVTAWKAPVIPLVSAQGFTLDASTALVVGSEASGTSHAFRMSATMATEIPFKVSRKNASALRLPMGQVAVLGGDPTLESFIQAP